MSTATHHIDETVAINVGSETLEGHLVVPEDAGGIVIFAHGSGSSRHSPRNNYVAQSLQSRWLGTLLFDLLTAQEEAIDARTAQLRFGIGLLADRLIGATDWITQNRDMADMKLGYFGASTGAGAALVAATARPDVVAAVVSRGGRPDLAEDALRHVQAPTLLIVGSRDEPVMDMNREALDMLSRVEDKELAIVPGASHLFEEPGTLAEVARLAGDWFGRYLVPSLPVGEV
jgi:dienelactone hydrolase